MAVTTINEKGQEVNDPTPLTLDVTPTSKSLDDRIRHMISNHMSQIAAEKGMETWEESNDFDVKDDFETDEQQTNYELFEEEWPNEPPKQNTESQQPNNETEEDIQKLNNDKVQDDKTANDKQDSSESV